MFRIKAQGQFFGDNGKFLDFLIQPGEVHEVRALNLQRKSGDKHSTNACGFFDEREKMVEAVLNLDQGFWEKHAFCPGVYLTTNPVDPSLTSLANNRTVAAKTTSKDENVIRWANLFLDFDPVRRGSNGAILRGVMATDTERGEVEKVVGAVLSYLEAVGFPQPAILDSGNGLQVLYALDWECTPESDAIVKGILTYLSGRFGSPGCEIDTTVANRARICRFPGTWNRKGDATNERPHRRSAVLSVPEERVCVPWKIASALAKLAAPKESKPSEGGKLSMPTHGGCPQLGIDPVSAVPSGKKWTQERLEAALEAADMTFNGPVSHGPHVVKYFLTPCPFDESHTKKDACIFLDISGEKEGQVAFRCLHNSCSDKHWADIRALLIPHEEKATPKNWDKYESGEPLSGDFQPQIPPKSSSRVIDPQDGLRTSKIIGEECFTQDGDSTLISRNDAWMSFNGQHYEEVSQTEMEKNLYAWLGTKSYMKSAKDGAIEAPVKPNKKLVGDLSHALRAYVCNDKLEEGTYFGRDRSFPKNVVNFRNGLLDVQEYVKGNVRLLPHTPLYFGLSGLNHDFTPDAGCPQWLAFLADIFNDDQQSIGAIQEWFGYHLTSDASFHKMHIWQGDKRAGKGTCTRILSTLIGDRNVCWPDLDDLGGRFGLEPIFGKSAAIIGDATLGRLSDGRRITGRFKSLTGEDRVNIDRKGRPSLTNVRWGGKITLLCNEVPTLADDSGALASRMIYVHFPNSYLGKEDRGLEDRLLSETPGILLWALEGLRKLTAAGRLTQPESGLELKRDFEELSAHTLPFIREFCELGEGHSILSESLFGVWKCYCEANNILNVGNAATFGKWLPRGVTRKKGSTGQRPYSYHGIALNSYGMIRFNVPPTHQSTS